LGRLDGGVVVIPSSKNDLAPERDVTETALLLASIQENFPVIGVCRGMQAMNLFHGGSLAPVSGHVGIAHPLTSAGGITGLEDFCFDHEVNSFHDFGIPPDGVGAGLRVLADSDRWPEAFVHGEYKHLGIMWHPERNTPFSENDAALFRRFFSSGGQ
jgi:putative glutamine amidotransferase